MTRLVSETPAHADAVERVLDRAFGPGRHAKTSERVRERGARFEPALSRVALEEDGAVVGCCRIWSVSIGSEACFFLGPLAVDPAHQHVGQGANLVQASLSACQAAGGGAVVLVGALPFFAPLGFSQVPDHQIALPGPVDPRRLLWRALRPGGLDNLAGEVSAPRAASPA